MKMSKAYRERVLSALATEVVMDQVRRALELGYSASDVELSVMRGMGHGLAEFKMGEMMRRHRAAHDQPRLGKMKGILGLSK